VGGILLVRGRRMDALALHAFEYLVCRRLDVGRTGLSVKSIC
jgi:hypothetical protein